VRKVSVIIPTYNRSNLITEAVESVLQQSFADFEVLVIDDGSTDNTRSVITQISDNRVKYFYKENGGAASARNSGIGRAEGEYIAFLDSDDLWPKEYLAVMTSRLDNTPDYGVAYCPITKARADGNVVKAYRSKHCRSGWVGQFYFRRGFVTCQGSVIRRQILDGLYFDENLENYEDMDFILRLSLQTRFLYVPDTNAVRRIQKNSLTRRDGVHRIHHNQVRLLERFYYELGGSDILSRTAAKTRIDRACRSVALRYYSAGAFKAAIFMFRRAISYNKLDIAAYLGLVKALTKSRTDDTMPDWSPPKPLPSSYARMTL
jgi:glycosyltransferase involved in cell wall biosynthesis